MTNVNLTLPMTLDEAEKVIIIETLALFNGNRTHAAAALDIGIRTLQRKLKQYGINSEHSDVS